MPARKVEQAVLPELLDSLLTRAPKAARELGYVAEGVAIGSRARRLRASWQAHLEATRAFVDTCATGGEHLLVLGSGRLLDLPLEAVAGRYARVTLVDWVHGRPARRRAARCKNVVLHEVDITGCAASLLGLRQVPPLVHVTAVANPAPFLSGLPAPDATVSLNLASQLPILPIQRLQALGAGRATCDAYGRALIAAHLDTLAALPGRVAAIFDVERLYTYVDGARETESSVHGLALPAPVRTWRWSLAPNGEIDRRFSMDLAVNAWDDWAAVWPLPSA